jgi:hypothetical protein
MSVAEVNELSDRLGAKAPRPIPSSNPFGNYEIEKDSTNVWLGFEDGLLKTYKAGRLYGVKGLETTATENLCTGERREWGDWKSLAASQKQQ